MRHLLNWITDLFLSILLFILWLIPNNVRGFIKQKYFKYTTTNFLYNKSRDSIASWNGHAWSDNNTAGAYFYTIEKANNNGYFYHCKKCNTKDSVVPMCNDCKKSIS